MLFLLLPTPSMQPIQASNDSLIENIIRVYEEDLRLLQEKKDHFGEVDISRSSEYQWSITFPINVCKKYLTILESLREGMFGEADFLWLENADIKSSAPLDRNGASNLLAIIYLLEQCGTDIHDREANISKALCYTEESYNCAISEYVKALLHYEDIGKKSGKVNMYAYFLSQSNEFNKDKGTGSIFNTVLNELLIHEFIKLRQYFDNNLEEVHNPEHQQARTILDDYIFGPDL